MDNLILRRIPPSSPPPDGEYHDYSVIFDGVVVGRISKQHWMPPNGEPWHWSITCLFRNPDYPERSPCPQKGRSDAGGTATTFEEAKLRFRAIWDIADPAIEYTRADAAECRVRTHYKAYCEAQGINLYGLRGDDRPSHEDITRWLDERGIDMPPSREPRVAPPNSRGS